MLQQTRVETVIPYFERWMKRYPSLTALADAPLQDVLAAWEGMGYYGRARNLHQAAQMVIREYHGKLPQDVRQLRKLPGIGRYTAAAIASMAYGKDEPTLDGNIRRVLARYFNVSEDARSTAGEQKLWQLAIENLPHGQAGEYNQALMDLGASMCTPKKPDCDHCPLQAGCQANLFGIQEQRPVVLPKGAIPHYTVTAAVIRRDGKVLIDRRPMHGLLGGLWEFPGGKQEAGESLSVCLQRELVEELGVKVEVLDQLAIYKHAYTHFKVTVFTFNCRLVEGEPLPIQPDEVRWVPPDELSQFPMGKVDRQISKTLLSSMPL